jgi:Spy/CpxP family protein refolding chaperone
MKTSSKLSLVFVLAALVAAPFTFAADPAPAAAPAPDSGAKARPAMRHMAEKRMELLNEKLNLTADQQTKIKAIWKQSAEQGKALHEDKALTREDRRAKTDALRKSARDQVRAVLTPAQQATFDQMPADGPDRPEGKGKGKDKDHS